MKALIGIDSESRIRFSEEFDGAGGALFKACAERELEGIVSKHVLSPYRSGRSKTWLKTKCFTESTFVMVETDRDGKNGALRALLAHHDSAGLIYAGTAFIALTSWASFWSSRLLTEVKCANLTSRCGLSIWLEAKCSATRR